MFLYDAQGLERGRVGSLILGERTGRIQIRTLLSSLGETRQLPSCLWCVTKSVTSAMTVLQPQVWWEIHTEAFVVLLKPCGSRVGQRKAGTLGLRAFSPSRM